MTAMSTIRTMIPGEIWCLFGFFILCVPTLGFVVGDLVFDCKSIIARARTGKQVQNENEVEQLIREQRNEKKITRSRSCESCESSRSKTTIRRNNGSSDLQDEEMGNNSYCPTSSEDDGDPEVRPPFKGAYNGSLTMIRATRESLSPSSPSLRGWNCAIWCSILVLLYAFLRLCMGVFHLRHHSKDPFEHAYDLFELVLRGIALYYLGNLDDSHLHGRRRQRRLVTNVLVFLYCLFWYSFTYEVCPNSFQFSANFEGSTLILFIIGMGSSMAFYVFTCNFCYHLRLLIAPTRTIAATSDYEESPERREGLLWLMGLILTVFFHLTLILQYGSYVHLHHHWNGLLLALFCRHPYRDSSIAVQALGCAFFLHGVAFFGVSPLYDS